MSFSLAVKTAIVGWTSDLVGVWLMTLSTIAVSLATLIYLADRDPIAVSFVVCGYPRLTRGLSVSSKRH